MRLLLPLLMTLAVSCASGAHAGGSDLDSLRTLRGFDGTHTFSVRSVGSEAVAGYIVEFFQAPDGADDQRDWPAGVVLVQDLDLKNVGFISVAGKGYRYDKNGDSQPLAARGRHAQIATLLGVEEPLEIRSALHGVRVPKSGTGHGTSAR